MTNCRFGRGGPAFVAGLALAAFLFCPLSSAIADELDEDFLFASGLIEIGFPDFAEKVVQQVIRLHPDQKDRAKLIQAEILISRRKFSEAEELVKTMGAENPKAQAISLALAKGYYAAGDMEKSKQLYNSFFGQYEGRTPTDPDLLRFYQESAYQFGQMLEQANDKAGAIKAYDRVIATNPDRNTARQLQAKQAELYVQMADGAALDVRDRNLASAKKICETIQWGGLDIPFGHSVITMAHIQLVLGDRAGAQKVLTGNMDILKEIDGVMKEQEMPLSESPMAGARFLLGKLYRGQADAIAKSPDKKDAAVTAYSNSLIEFYNVFAKYGTSDWGPQAGVQAQEIKTILETQFGKKVNVELGGYQTKAAEAQFRLADNLFRQKQYPQAAEEYIKNLNSFPETDSSAPALGNLMLGYANLDDKLMVKMVADYLGERFSSKEPAALALLSLGKMYFDKNDEPMYMMAYETYLRFFPKHPRAAGVLFTLSGLRKKAGDEAGATKFLERIVQNYPTDAFYPKALSQLAWGYYLSTNYAGAVKGFGVYLAEAQPSPEKAQAQFALADSLRQLGSLTNALVEYEKLIQWLVPKNNPFGTSAADVQKNSDLLEKAAFQRGYCYARIKQPPESIPEMREKGIRAYDQFLQLFPQSRLASAALSAKGAILLEVGRFDEATKTFDELAAKYPQSDEGKSALFALVRAAMEIKQYDQARSAFAKMLTGGGKYTPDQFSRLGQLMLDAGLYAEAIQAFEQVLATAQDRPLLERALYGVGRANYQLKNYNETIRSLEDLMKRYPKSGLFYDAKFTLGTAYRELGSYSNAVLALGDVMRFADKTLLINKASYDLGTIQREQGDKLGALASFLRVALLADPDNPELRPLVEKSILESISLGMELKRYQDVQDSCDQYVKLFPSGDKIEDVRRAKGDAKLKAAQAAAAPPPAAAPGTTPEKK
jgi:tetratricopeptide (TPR) repeat protein